MNVYFTSDTHWGHKNVIDYCSRPHKTIDEMDRDLISKWNSRITASDEVYFLGDFTLNPKFYASVLPRLLFKKMHFVLGNHDRKNRLKKTIDEYGLDIQIYSTLDVDINGTRFHLVHKPILASDDFPNLCGHVHEKWLLRKPGDVITEKRKDFEAKRTLRSPVLNVGVDVHNYFPISIEEVLEHLNPYL